VAFLESLTEEEALLIVAARAAGRSGRLRRVREAAGLSRQDIANAIGTSRANVESWEKGATRPRRESAIRLARLLIALEKATGNGDDGT
jgi:transcriptional regulator with XRE-family HTH domain